jgi:hypothetical protein
MLGQLIERYPLPLGWALPEHFSEKVTIGSSTIELSGLSVSDVEGEQITGSAASADASGSATARSYFELLERVSVITAMRDRHGDYELLDRAGRLRGRARRCDLFPESPEPHRWRPSRSNGIALHLSWQEACDRAAAELVERDRVLRSWYGERAPVPCELPEELIPEGLRALAAWRAYELSAPSAGIGRAFTVVAVLAFPRAESTPIAYGFAAHLDRELAIKAAAGEAVQRFGFLFGEAVPGEVPSVSPTPDFHQEFFLFPPSHRILCEWLDSTSETSGSSGSPSGTAAGSGPDVDDDLLFVDLTPKHLRGLLLVAKAICERAEPLVFGEPAPHRARANPDRRVHPVA